MYKKRLGGDSEVVRDAVQPVVLPLASVGSNGNSPSVRKSTATKLPILLIESNSLLRDGLTSLLAQSRFWVVGAGPTLDAIPRAIEETPEIILIGANNVAAIAAILEKCRARYPLARRVVLHECGGGHLVQILKAGAHACLGQAATTDALLMTLDLAMQGVTVISSPLGFAENENLAPDPQHQGAGEDRRSHLTTVEASHKLSVREIAILDCLVHGDSNKLIARKFQIAEATVKVHVKAILRKIRAANRTQAAIWAINNLSAARAHTNM